MADRHLRALLLGYLRHGKLTADEAAHIAAVTKWAVYKWCAQAGFNAGRARERYVTALGRDLLDRSEELGSGIRTEIRYDQDELGPRTQQLRQRGSVLSRRVRGKAKTGTGD